MCEPVIVESFLENQPRTLGADANAFAFWIRNPDQPSVGVVQTSGKTLAEIGFDEVMSGSPDTEGRIMALTPGGVLVSGGSRIPLEVGVSRSISRQGGVFTQTLELNGVAFIVILGCTRPTCPPTITLASE